MNNNVFQTLDKVLHEHTTSVFDGLIAVDELLQTQDLKTQKLYLRTFCDECESLDCFAKECNMGAFDGDDFKQAQTLLNQVVSSLIKKNVSEEDFYEELQEKYRDETLFDSSSKRACFLLTVWIDQRIPYYHLHEGCKMENEEYRELQTKILNQLKTAKFIVYRGGLQKTEQASLLMELAQTITDERERAVFWATVSSYQAVLYYRFKKSQEAQSKTEEAE